MEEEQDKQNENTDSIIIQPVRERHVDAATLRDRAIREHFKNPRRFHPDETKAQYEARRALYKESGKWPNYMDMPGAKIVVKYGLPSTYNLTEEQLQELMDKGVEISDQVLAYLERGDTMGRLSHRNRAIAAIRSNDSGVSEVAEALVNNGRKALAAMGIENPDEMELGELALTIARAALIVAAQGMTKLSAEKLVQTAQKSVQIAQLLSGKPTSVVGVLKPEVARRLVEISQMLKDAEGEVIEGELADEPQRP